MKLLEEKIGVNIHELGFSHAFSAMIPKHKWQKLDVGVTHTSMGKIDSLVNGVGPSRWLYRVK